MTTATDMNDLATAGDLLVDQYLGGHTDAILTTFLSVKGLYKNESKAIRLICGLAGELINKVYDLENAP